MNRVRRDERGTALILAIAFLVAVAGISTAVISSVTSGLRDRAVLDQVRNREYAADGAIERAVVKVRATGGTDASQCANLQYTGAQAANAVNIRVDCTLNPQPLLDPDGNIVAQNNVIFAACTNLAATCTPAASVITAQVNFQGASPGTTYVQSWSVNK